VLIGNFRINFGVIFFSYLVKLELNTKVNTDYIVGSR